MNNETNKNTRHKRTVTHILAGIFCVLLIAVAAFFISVSVVYYHAGEEALSYLEPDETVTVGKTEYGW